MAKEMCEDCGKIVEMNQKQFLCPECRRKRLSKYAKQRKLNKLGVEAKKNHNPFDIIKKECGECKSFDGYDCTRKLNEGCLKDE